jgi:hypothetical protein
MNTRPDVQILLKFSIFPVKYVMPNRRGQLNLYRFQVNIKKSVGTSINVEKSRITAQISPSRQLLNIIDVCAQVKPTKHQLKSVKSNLNQEKSKRIKA